MGPVAKLRLALIERGKEKICDCAFNRAPGIQLIPPFLKSGGRGPAPDVVMVAVMIACDLGRGGDRGDLGDDRGGDEATNAIEYQPNRWV